MAYPTVDVTDDIGVVRTQRSDLMSAEAEDDGIP